MQKQEYTRCRVPWQYRMTLADIEALLAPAFGAYEQARSLASAGNYAQARLSLANAHQSGLSRHPAVARLDTLCAAALEATPRIPPATAPRLPSGFAWGVGVSGAAAFTAVGLSCAALLRPFPVPSAMPPAPVSPLAGVVRRLPVPTAAKKPASALLVPASDLPPALRREYADARASTDEQQARRWLNEAVRALRHRDTSRARSLARAAYRVGQGTYVAEEAFLLVARATDEGRSASASSTWAQFADIYPHSRYAPAALAAAARAADRQEQSDAANQFRQRLQAGYPASAEARRSRAESFRVLTAQVRPVKSGTTP